MKRGVILVVFIALCFVSNSIGQDLRKVLQSIKDEYASTKAMHVKASLVVVDRTTEEVIMADNFELKRLGEKAYYVSNKNEMLLNDDYLINVSNLERVIVIMQRKDKSELNATALPVMDMDSIFSFYESPEYLGLKKDEHQYKVYQKEGDIEWVHLFFNKSQSNITKIKYTYREGTGYENLKVTMKYDVLNFHANWKQADFSENKIVRYEKNNWFGIGKYKGYNTKVVEGPKRKVKVKN